MTLAGLSGDGGCRRRRRAAARAQQRKPTMAEASEPVSTPSLVASTAAGSVKASAPMNRLMVKPMPHSSATPYSCA